MATTHEVKAGDGLDSLWKLSEHYGVTFQAIKDANPHLKNRDPDPSKNWWINVGDIINIPSSTQKD